MPAPRVRPQRSSGRPKSGLERGGDTCHTRGTRIGEFHAAAKVACSSSPGGMTANKSESKPLNSSQVLSGIRDLIVHLHRGNATQAESIVSNVSQHLKDVLQSGADPEDAEV